jgi:hypothetical protein
MVSKMSAANQIPLEELSEQMNAQQEMISQQEQEEAKTQPQEQRQDHNPKYRRIKHINNWDDEDFRFEKFKKTNNKRSRWN